MNNSRRTYTKSLKLDQESHEKVTRISKAYCMSRQDFVNNLILASDFDIDKYKNLKDIPCQSTNATYISDDAHEKLKRLKNKSGFRLHSFIYMWLCEDDEIVIDRVMNYFKSKLRKIN